MKVLYVATVYRHFTSFHLPYLKWLKDMGCEVHVAASGDESVRAWDQNISYVDKNFDIPLQRSPYSSQNLRAYSQLKEIIDREQYDMVHCHTPMGGVVGRLAARSARKKGTKVVYTAHGFHFCKGAPKLNWMLYYPVEKFMARYTDALITINSEDYETAKSFKVNEHYSIPGIGLDIDKFKRNNTVKEEKRDELNIPQEDIVIVSVGDLTRRKNHEVVIKAISKLDYPNMKYLICGKGVLEGYLRELCSKLKVEDKVVFMGYRKDIGGILKASDIFIFPSLWEGLGLAGIEAMATKIPTIMSNRHGILDYSIENETALLCDPEDENCVAKSIERLVKDKELVEKITRNAYENIDKYDISMAMEEMQGIYREIIPELFENEAGREL